MKKRIAFDQDQVLADLLTEWVSRYNTEYNDNLRPEDIKNWNWHNLVKPECGKKIYNHTPPESPCL
jgi:5'(3')-deoxyribonucleotidase